jgi:hypothetical protein
MAAAAKLKKQIEDLIVSDSSVVKAIANAVSSLIVETIRTDTEIINTIASNISSNDDFSKAVMNKFMEKAKPMKQEIYESLSFDNNNLSIKVKGKESYNELKLSNETLHLEIDNLEQYRRRNCLLFHGVREQEGAATRSQTENTDAIVVSIMKEKLGLEISEADLDRSHRLGRKVPNVQPHPRPRPIIVKFLSHNIRSQVYRNKRKLKGLGLGISESLTKKRAELYSTVSRHPNVSSVWTNDGRIIALLSDKRKVVLESNSELSTLS